MPDEDDEEISVSPIKARPYGTSDENESDGAESTDQSQDTDDQNNQEKEVQ
jgi:hypothetical protein